MDSREISKEQIGNFVEYLNQHKSIIGVKFVFNPLTAYILATDSNYDTLKSIVNHYINWWENNPNAQHFDIIIE